MPTPKRQALDLTQVYVDKRDGAIYDPKVPRTTRVQSQAEMAKTKAYPAWVEKDMRKQYGVDWDKRDARDKAMRMDQHYAGVEGLGTLYRTATGRLGKKK